MAGNTSVSPICERMKQLYKKPATPPWKDTLRQRALKRLRDSRDRVISFHRGAIDDCEYGARNTLFPVQQQQQPITQYAMSPCGSMERNFSWPANFSAPATVVASQNALANRCLEEEWRQLQAELAIDPSAINVYLSIFEEIQQELMREEQTMIDNYESSERDELDAVVSSYFDQQQQQQQGDELNLSTSPIVGPAAPICARCSLGTLVVDCLRGSVACTACNLHVDKLSAALPSTGLLHVRMEEAVERHKRQLKSSCPNARPSFSVVRTAERDDEHRLLVVCQFCGFEFVVF